MKIERASQATPELLDALKRLLPQLSERPTPTTPELAELLAAPGAVLLVGRDDDGAIAGTLTLVLFRTPTGLRGRIEDVVVDEAARGCGLGEALTREALRLAAERGATEVELTSRPVREAANRLYRRVGFALKETNVFTHRLN